MTDIAKSHVSVSGQVHPAERPLRRFLIANRAALGSLVIFVLMMLTFFIANPVVFSNWGLYLAVMTTLPVALFLVAPRVFVVTGGEVRRCLTRGVAFTK
jgi:simple sugar transport system permease protein